MATPRRADLTVQVFAGTDVGQVREHNEDSFAVISSTVTSSHPAELPSAFTQTLTVDDHGLLFMVADGMGGAAAGEIASSMAIEILQDEIHAYWSSVVTPEPSSFASALARAASRANARIHQYAVEHPEYHGMGTTATIVGALHDTLYLAQVGDSRAYLMRGGQVSQLTKDQSLMQRLIDAGEITAEEAEVSDRRNIILQALGPEPQVNIDVTYQPLRRGDLLIMCTDGLSGVLRHQEISQTAFEVRDVSDIGTRLIAAANAHGGPDNITVIAARFEGASLADASTNDSVGHLTFPLPLANRTPLGSPLIINQDTMVTQEMLTIVSVPPSRQSPSRQTSIWILTIVLITLLGFLALHHHS